MATPWPTPTHMLAKASLPPRFSMPCTAVSASRAPLMPSGWPSAIAPPCGLTKSASSLTPSCRKQAMPCEAKASLSSIKSKSEILMPSRSISFLVAGTGPMPMMRGGTAAEANPRIRARGVSPCFFTAASDARIIAAAPSLTPDALPAGNREIDLAGADRATRGADRIEARCAEAIEGLAGNRFRHAREQQRHAGDVAVVLAGLVGAAEKHLIYLRPVEIGMLRHQRLDRRGGQIVGAHLGKRAAETADRGPDGIANEYITHRISP